MKNLIKKMLRETLLVEGKQVGSLYHFTDITKAREILQSGVMFTHMEKFKQSERIFTCVSTTRDKNFWDVPRELGARAQVRFNLNGDAISNRYQIKPFNYFNSMGARGDNPAYNESEEIIIIPARNDGFKFDDYLIDITCDLNVLYKNNQRRFSEYEEMEQHMRPILEDLLRLTYNCSEQGYSINIINNNEMSGSPILGPIIHEMSKYITNGEFY